METGSKQTSQPRIIKLREAESYWDIVKRQFRKNKTGMWSLRFLIGMIIVALLADFIANEAPIVCKYNGKIYFPIIEKYLADLDIRKLPQELVGVSYKDLDYEWVIFPPVPYSPTNVDYDNRYVGPFDEQNVKSFFWRHHLGTNELGKDVLAGLIHGTRYALSVGVVAMSIAAIIGIVLGGLAGFLGDDKLKARRASILGIIIGFLFGIFWAFSSRSYSLENALKEGVISFTWELVLSFLIVAVSIAVFYLIALPLRKVKFFIKEVSIPVDMIISRLIEVFLSVPTFFLIVAIVAIAKPSIILVMVIIGLTSWTGIARFMRGELLRIRSMEYIKAAYSIGMKEWYILWKHAIPNGLPPVLIAIAFGVASAILIEATLSFLGIGVPPEAFSWGHMLASARQYPQAWWLAIIPGMAIMFTVSILNLIGEALIDAMNPRLKH